jgi:hypothetical protein
LLAHTSLFLFSTLISFLPLFLITHTHKTLSLFSLLHTHTLSLLSLPLCRTQRPPSFFHTCTLSFYDPPLSRFKGLLTSPEVEKITAALENDGAIR